MVITAPFQLFDFLNFLKKYLFNSGSYLEVGSASFVAECNNPDPTSCVSGASGVHFCKLLSPAKAIEFIYVDALYETFYSES